MFKLKNSDIIKLKNNKMNLNNPSASSNKKIILKRKIMES